LKICQSEPLKQYLKEAEQDMHNSDYWNNDVQAAVKELTNITGTTVNPHPTGSKGHGFDVHFSRAGPNFEPPKRPNANDD
jgi:hypothetical protein